MARARNQGQRRSELVDAAARAVLQQGSTEAKLRDVAEQAELTPASVLYYFRDKQELLSEVYGRGTASYVKRRQALLGEGSTAWERLEACISSGVPADEKELDASQLLVELLPLTFRDEAASQAQQEFVREQVALYESVLERGAADGEFTLALPAPALARTLLALEDGFVPAVISGRLGPADVRDQILAVAKVLTAPRSAD